MNLLISNDAGVHTPGIITLADELGTIANVNVSVPNRDPRGASNSLTFSRPLKSTFLDNGNVSITPMRIGVTRYDAFSDLNKWLEDMK